MQAFESLSDPCAGLVPRRTRLLRRAGAIAAALALHGAILAALVALPRAHPPVAERPLIVPVELAYLAPAAVPAARPSDAPAAAEAEPPPHPPRPAEPETRAIAPRPTPVAEAALPAPPPPRPVPPRPPQKAATPPLPASIPVAAPAHLAAATPVASPARAEMESDSASAPEAATKAGTVTTPSSSPLVPKWEAEVLARLERFKRYPRGARMRQQEGVAYLRFTVGRHGDVLAYALQRSSGISALDEETLSLVSRAAPFPAPPAELGRDSVELVVPIRYVLR